MYKHFPATTLAAMLDFLECPRMGITRLAENVLLDLQGPESSEKNILTNIKGYTKILPD